MKKTKVNFIIDALMFLCMSAIAGIGFLIKYTLLPGQKRWIVYGDNVELYLWGMDRHEWGEIHLIIGFTFLGLLALHIILHWKVVVNIYKRKFQWKKIKGIIAVLFISICSLFIIVPFLMEPTVAKIDRGEGRQSMEKNNPMKKEERNEIKFSEKLSHINLNIEVRGYMTIDENRKNIAFQRNS